jgi:hypothetical protein
MEFYLQEFLKSVAGAGLQNTRYVLSMQVEFIDRFHRGAPYGQRGSRAERNAASEQSILVRL